jgi:hypothetical protein
LQSLVSWAEGVGVDAERLPQSGFFRLKSKASLSQSSETDDDEFLCDLESDSLATMHSYAEAMADLLKLPSPSFDQLTVQSVYSADFLNDLRTEVRLQPAERSLIRNLVLHNFRFFVPRTGLVYLGTPSSNGTAELAAVILAKGHSPRTPIFGETTDSFFQAVMDQAFGFFGSLLVNPRRKCDLPEDHLQRYLQLKMKPDSGVNYERQARLYTLAGMEEQARFLERMRRQTSRRKDSDAQNPPWGITVIADQVLHSRGAAGHHARLSLWLAGRYLGQILGKLLHRALLQGDVSLDQIRELAWQASDRRWRPAEVRYWEWVSVVASQNLPVSKRQMI